MKRPISSSPKLIVRILVVFLGVGMLAATPAHAGPPKITICHSPPGNPANPQIISVSIFAWPAHEGHGDSLGECSDLDDQGGEPDDQIGGGSGGVATFEVAVCDGRQGEQGRHVQVASSGRVRVDQIECQ